MKPRRFVTAALLAAALAAAPAGVDAAPVLRVQVEQKGDMLLIGNTLGYDCDPATPMPITGTVGACGSGVTDSSPDIFWRADAPMPGQAIADDTIAAASARSSAVLTLPAGAAVTHAYLYWGARRAAALADLTVTLEREGVFTKNLTAGGSWLGASGNNQLYQSVADVTSLVSTHGSGAYRVSGVDTSNFVNSNNDSHYAGWWLVVFYRLDTEPIRNLALFDGLEIVTNFASQDVTLSGFLVPGAGYDAKLGVITYEGDNATTGDSLSFNGVLKTDMQNPADNFFNGTRSVLGTASHTAGDLPELTGGPQSMSGIDIDIVDVTADVMPGDTSAMIQATSTGDQYFLGGFVTSISTFKPDYSASAKTAVDQNGGALLPGDVLEYTIAATNTGNDTSIDTVLTDPLPMGVTYVPASLQITSGPNAGMKTDAAGDDQGEYTAANRTVTVRLGNGAGATQGGTLAVGESTTVVFRVTVDPGFSGVVSNQATIHSGGVLGSPPEDDATDGNGSAMGNPPTDVVVDVCATDADCAAPTPACDTAPAPNVCVECLTDSHCGGLMPTCDTSNQVCTCIASGPEQCDAIDNDCNGAVDEDLENCSCQTDADCGGLKSGIVCSDDLQICTPGCRGTGGNGCPEPLECTSMDTSIGMCTGAGGQGGADAQGSVYVSGGCTCSTPSEKDASPPGWLWLLAAGLAFCRRKQRATA